jgi:hypothetical protein
MKHIHKASSAKLVYGVGYGLQLGRNINHIWLGYCRPGTLVKSEVKVLVALGLLRQTSRKRRFRNSSVGQDFEVSCKGCCRLDPCGHIRRNRASMDKDYIERVLAVFLSKGLVEHIDLHFR